MIPLYLLNKICQTNQIEHDNKKRINIKPIRRIIIATPQSTNSPINPPFNPFHPSSPSTLTETAPSSTSAADNPPQQPPDHFCSLPVVYSSSGTNSPKFLLTPTSFLSSLSYCERARSSSISTTTSILIRCGGSFGGGSLVGLMVKREMGGGRCCRIVMGIWVACGGAVGY